MHFMQMPKNWEGCLTAINKMTIQQILYVLTLNKDFAKKERNVFIPMILRSVEPNK